MFPKLSTMIWVSAVALVFAIPATPSAGFCWGNPNVLVELNDAVLTKQDFLDWWHIWREENTPPPETADDFIDWMLLSQEAENMQLYDRPLYRKKVSVFLRVRSLMMLKQEEVNSKIGQPAREDLWPVYAQKYAPRFNLKLVSVETEEQRHGIASALEKGATLDEAARAVGLLDGSTYLSATGLMRPEKIPVPLRDAARTLQVGEAAGPVFFEPYTYFFEVLDREDANDADFETLRDRLTRQWHKQQVSRLTTALIDRLNSKYQVAIDEELLEHIGLEPLDPETAARTVIRIDDIQVSAGTLQSLVAKDYHFRYGQYDKQPASLDSLRRQIVADMLSQTVSSKEALSRHYEKRDPLRREYTFYCQNRLIKELEQSLIAPQITLTDTDIEAAYRQNLGTYTRHGMVELMMVQTTEEELARLAETELVRGGDFEKTVAPLAPAGVEIRKIPFDHLREPVRNVVARLAPGQASPMIAVDDTFCFVKLIGRDKQHVMPLEMVREQLERELYLRRFQERRASLVAQLRERSRITVKQKAWMQIADHLKREYDEYREQ